MDRFIFMLEWDAPVQHLTNEEKGILFQNLLNNAQGLPLDETNRAVNIAWGFIKPNLDRMTEKWLKDFENGKKGGAPKGNIPWNKKRTQSEPPAHPKGTLIEGERTYKEKDKENYKENYKAKEEVKVEIKLEENSYTNSLDKVLPTSKTLSQNTNTGTNTRTREEEISNLFQPMEPKKEIQNLYHNLTPELQREADMQLERELQKMINK